MDINRLKRILLGQAKKAGVADDQIIEGLVTDAVDMACPYVWKSRAWKFRRKETTVTTTGSQEYAELPDDFDGFAGLRYRNGTSEGWQLNYHDEDTYEYSYPNPQLYSDDAPKVVKIVYDKGSEKWRAYFTPRPDAAYSLTLIYYAKWGTLAEFPEGFEKLLMAACWLFIYPAGSQSWMAADAGVSEAFAECEEYVDSINKSLPSVVRRSRRFNVDGGDNVPDDWYTVSDGSDY